MPNGQIITHSNTRTQAFEVAKGALLTLRKVRAELTPAELETLDIFADPESVEQLKKSREDIKNGRLEPLESILE